MAAGDEPVVEPPSAERHLFNYVEMSDGVKISATLLLPVGEGPFPPVIISSPYGDSVANPDFGIAPTLVENGYAVIVADWRGTGCSGGVADLGSQRFRDDGAELISWAADQEWSTGKVGMAGASARGIAQWIIASEAPEELVAMAPATYISDMYRDASYVGGILNYQNSIRWPLVDQPRQSARVERTADAQCLENRQMHSREPILGGDHLLSFMHDGHFYRDRSVTNFASTWKIPTLMFLATQDGYAPANGVELFERVDAPRRLLITNGGHGMSRMPAAQAEVVRWFDHWLKGEENGVEAGSSVRTFFETKRDRELGFDREYEQWPPETTTPRTLFLSPDAILSSQVPEEITTDSYAYSAAPPEDRLSAPVFAGFGQGWRTMSDAGLRYVSPVFQTSTELAGSPLLDLDVSVSTFDTDFLAVLSEKSPSGDVVYISHTLLRGSQREIVAEADPSTILRYAGVRSVPLVPNEITHIRMQFPPVVHALREGSSLQLDLLPAWVATYELGMKIVPSPYDSTITVHHGEGTVLTLPVTAEGTELPPAPACGERPGQPCRPAP